jgi:hypothetical protein
MIKPNKKRRGDANQIAASVVSDAIKQSTKTVKFPAISGQRKSVSATAPDARR